MTDSLHPSNRVVIVGAGNVGSTIAYSLLNLEIARSILLIDISEEIEKAQVLDLQDASNFTNGVHVISADYKDIIDGDIVVITSGAPQKEGQTRMDLLSTNASIIKDVIGQIKVTKKNVYILMVTNPVDIMTSVALKESGLPANQVFGSGTLLDTARLRMAISKELNVSSSNVHAYILGEHGDTSFPVLSSATVGGIALSNFMNVNEEFYKQTTEKIRNTAYEIIKGKKATYYGIGSSVSKICRAIIRDERKLFPVSVALNGEYGFYDVCISVPARIGHQGAQVVGQINLSSQEVKMFHESVNAIKESMKA